MARGRGAPRASPAGVRGRGPSASAGSAGVVAPAGAGNALIHDGAAGSVGACALTKCGTCNANVGNEGIGCDRCDGWFHPAAMCMGLPDKVIESIVGQGGEGVLFVCLTCRINSCSSGSSRRASDAGSDLTATVKQLHEMVISLCTAVKTLMTSPILPQAQSQPQSVCPTVASDDLDMRIREQIREVRDREVRRDSVIIRGLPNSDVSKVCEVFKEASLFLIEREVILHDPVCINRERGIFRGKVPNIDDRKSLLAACYKLKHSDMYSSLYINRDLTYRQRQELRARRAAANRDRTVVGESRSSETPSAQTAVSFLP